MQALWVSTHKTNSHKAAADRFQITRHSFPVPGVLAMLAFLPRGQGDQLILCLYSDFSPRH